MLIPTKEVSLESDIKQWKTDLTSLSTCSETARAGRGRCHKIDSSVERVAREQIVMAPVISSKIALTDGGRVRLLLNRH